MLRMGSDSVLAHLFHCHVCKVLKYLGLPCAVSICYSPAKVIRDTVTKVFWYVFCLDYRLLC